MQQGLLLTLLLHSLFSDAVSFIVLLPSLTCHCCCFSLILLSSVAIINLFWLLIMLALVRSYHSSSDQEILCLPSIMQACYSLMRACRKCGREGAIAEGARPPALLHLVRRRCIMDSSGPSIDLNHQPSSTIILLPSHWRAGRPCT
jgi:hypothetical protein